MRSGVPNRSEEVVSVKSNGMISGFCVDVFIAALNLLPYAVPFELLAFGSGHDNPSNSELVRLIRTGSSRLYILYSRQKLERNMKVVSGFLINL